MHIAKSILNATRDFLDKAIVVFPMAFVLMLGEIDISVASIMALSATIMGVAFDAGVPDGLEQSVLHLSQALYAV